MASTRCQLHVWIVGSRIAVMRYIHLHYMTSAQWITQYVPTLNIQMEQCSL